MGIEWGSNQDSFLKSPRAPLIHDHPQSELFAGEIMWNPLVSCKHIHVDLNME